MFPLIHGAQTLPSNINYNPSSSSLLFPSLLNPNQTLILDPFLLLQLFIFFFSQWPWTLEALTLSSLTSPPENSSEVFLSRTRFSLENSHVVFSLSFYLSAVRKRPRMDGFVSAFNETGSIDVQHNAEDTIPLSLSFGKVLTLINLPLSLYIWLLSMFCITVCNRGFCHVVTVF